MVARLYDPVMYLPERSVLPPHREYLAAELRGDVLEIGCGTGAMFPYYAAIDGKIQSVTAIEPDPHMRRRAEERAESIGLDVTILDVKAESLPLDDQSVDAAIASLVFCTIPDREAALDELARVVRSGGEFRFLEHVRGSGLLGRVHDLIAPGWYHVAGGCHLDRETDRLFRTDDRFELLDYNRYETGVTRIVPLVRGTLERRRPTLLSRLA